MQIDKENQMELNDDLFSSPSFKLMNCPTEGTQLHGLGYIEHPVSRLDTLAGVAIKYGVEVVDIKKMNGLVTDLQMFALKTLHIPLPGRHPPSPSLSNGFDSARQSASEQTPTTCRPSTLFESLKLNSSPHQEVSLAMSKLQGYYGLLSTDQKPVSEGFKMAIHHKGGSHYLEDGPYREPSSFSNSNPPLSHHKKSRSMANCFLVENDALTNNALAGDARDATPDKLMEKLVRRRQKSVSDFSSHTPELLMKDDNSTSSGFSTTAGKGLALRQKANRATTAADSETWLQNPTGAPVTDNSRSVRKSSSTSNLPDSDNNTSSSSFIWPTSKWNLRPDRQVFSNSSITKPIFDGLPKPVTGRRNKAALD